MTRRLILLLTGVTVLLWLCAAALGALVMREEFDEVFDSALIETAQRLLPLVVDDIFRRNLAEAPMRLPHSPGTQADEYLTFQVRDGAGAVLLHSHDAPSEPFDAPPEPGFTDTPTHRVYTVTAVSGSIVLQVADPLAHRAEAMNEGLMALLLPLLALIPFSILAVWIIVRGALKPIGALSAEISARSGANLRPLAPGQVPFELSSIAESVDELLERLRRTLEAERSFTANSAHELRTPIAGALAQTQRLIEELPNGAAKVRAGQIETALSALSHLSEKLLQLARAESGIGLAVEPTDVMPILELIVEDFERKPEYAERLRYENRTHGKSVVRNVDVDAVGIVFRNLVENALVHGDVQAPVEISVSDDGTILITNGSKVVSSDGLQQLTKRFHRGQSAADGSGLGLAISEMLVRQMGGTLQYASPAKGRSDGFEVTLRLA